MRSAAILTGADTHLDHLGVLSAILRIPLIVTEERLFHLTKKFYPSCSVELLEPSALSLDYLAEQFDALFETGRFFASELSFPLKLFHNKTMRFVFCPHGNSDKGHSQEELACQDLSLFYGNHQLDLLKQNGAFPKIKTCIRSGNYRLPFYLKQRAFYDRIADEEIFKHFAEQRPVALYAPTWNASEHPTSLFFATEQIITELKDDFNLLIKVHPYLFQQHPAAVFALTAPYEEHPSVRFLCDFPPIYPLLAKSALYIGDYSSIGYDFLAFDRPLFFLSPQGLITPLQQCGTSLDALGKIKESVLSHLEQSFDPYSEIRRKTYLYAFGEEKSEDSLRADVFNALETRPLA